MLKNLNYNITKPRSRVYSVIARINNIDLSCEENYFQHYETGIYRHDGYLFNFDAFIEERCDENIINDMIMTGICDDYTQILERYGDLINDPNKNYVIGLCTVEREKQPSSGGWRWCCWGKYIGTQDPQHEYLYDDTHIDKVYCFHIYEIN